MSITLKKLAPHRWLAALRGRAGTHEAEGRSPLSAIHELEAVLHTKDLRVVESPEIEPERPKATKATTSAK